MISGVLLFVGLIVGYVIGRLKTQARYDKALLRRGLKRNG